MFLEINNLSVSYGGIRAIRDLSLSFERNKIVTIVGLNGAGKSTLLNSIIGLVPKASGSVYFDGEEIAGLPPHIIMRKGISLVPEGRMLFGHLTVRDNLYLGAYPFIKKLGKKEVEKRKERVYELFPILKDREDQLAGTLSGGQQQMLAIGRALMAHPKLLMLDEPSMGLAPIVVKEIFNVIRHLNEEGMSILLVEQNARAALKLSHYAFILDSGMVVAKGKGSDLLIDEKVKTAYLGG